MPKSKCVAVYRQRSNKTKSCKPRQSKKTAIVAAVEKKIPDVVDEKYDSPFSLMGREFSHATDTTVAAANLPTVEEKYPTLPDQYFTLNENPALRMGRPQPLAVTGSKVPTTNPFQQGTLGEIYMDPTLLQANDPPRNPDGIYPTAVLMRDVNPFEQLGVHTFTPIDVNLLANERNIINPYVMLNSGTVLPHTLAPKRVADTPDLPKPKRVHNVALLPAETQYQADPVNRYGAISTPARSTYLDINEIVVPGRPSMSILGRLPPPNRAPPKRPLNKVQQAFLQRKKDSANFLQAIFDEDNGDSKATEFYNNRSKLRAKKRLQTNSQRELLKRISAMPRVNLINRKRKLDYPIDIQEREFRRLNPISIYEEASQHPLLQATPRRSQRIRKPNIDQRSARRGYGFKSRR